MRRSLTTVILGLGLVGAASAQSYGYGNYAHNHNTYGYNHSAPKVDACVKQRKDGQTSGAIVGGLIGALAGGAIGNNIDNDNRHYRRGYRGYRGHGYNRHYRHHHRKNDNSGNVAAGAIVGGLIGAVAGSEIGKSNVNCRTYHDSVQTTHGYRGDPTIAPPTRQPWPEPTSSYPVSQPVSVQRTYPAPQNEQPADWPVYGGDELYGASQPCETLTRVTRLPDGREIREAVQNCKQGDVWYEKDGRRVQGGY